MNLKKNKINESLKPNWIIEFIIAIKFQLERWLSSHSKGTTLAFMLRWLFFESAGSYFRQKVNSVENWKKWWERKKIKRSLIWNFLLLLRRPHLRRTPEMEMATIFHENIFLLCCTSWQKKIFSCFCKKKLQRVCVYKILKYKTEMCEKLWYCPGGSSICWAQNICLSCRCNPQ